MKYSVSFLVLLATTLSSQAGNFTWNGGTGDWMDGSQWTPSGPPGGGSGNHAIINGGTANITSNTNLMQDTFVRGNGTINQTAGTHSNASWHFIGDTAGSDATYSISGGTAQTNRWYAGKDAATAKGTVNVTGSGTIVGTGSDAGNVAGVFGQGAGTSGFLNVSGANATAQFNGELWVGQAGGYGEVNHSAGVVNVTNWMAIGRSNATGVYNLSGTGVVNKTGSNQVILGSLSGQGTLNQSGGTFNANNDFRLGENAGANGKVNLTGGQLNVGAWTIVGWTGGGNGELNVGGGSTIATLASGYVEVGGGAGGAGNGIVNLLNNGVIAARVISRNTGGVSAQVNFDGGTFQATETNTEFLPNFSASDTEVKAGGLKVDTNGFDIATAVPLDGVGGLTKNGTGTLTLNGVSTYSGQTIINKGTLKLGAGASLNPSSIVNVAAGATFDGSATGVVVPVGQTLKGNGTTIGDTTVNGTISPGNSIGQLTIAGNLTLSGATDMEIDPSVSPNSDEIIVISPGTTITYGGTLNVTQIGGTLALGQTFDLFDATTFSSSFSTVNLPSLTGMGDGFWYWKNDLNIDGSLTVLPEPGSTGLFGLAALAAMARRRRK